jgi:hypothetical protein
MRIGVPIKLVESRLKNFITVSQFAKHMSNNSLAQFIILLKHLNRFASVCSSSLMEVQVSDPLPNLLVDQREVLPIRSSGPTLSLRFCLYRFGSHIHKAFFRMCMLGLRSSHLRATQ